MKSLKIENKSQIETRGFKAKFYDTLITLGTLGLYNKLLKKVIIDLNLTPDEKILDMGAGSGKNAVKISKHMNGRVKIVGLEIGKEMQQQFRRKIKTHPNISLKDMRIEKSLPFENEYDRVFISFVIHGFKQYNRISIINNAYKALKHGGKLHIFDWYEFNLKTSGILLKLFFNYIECPEAKDFITQDLKCTLLLTGFIEPEEKLYARKKIRLLTARKP